MYKCHMQTRVENTWRVKLNTLSDNVLVACRDKFYSRNYKALLNRKCKAEGLLVLPIRGARNCPCAQKQDGGGPTAIVTGFGIYSRSSLASWAALAALARRFTRRARRGLDARGPVIGSKGIINIICRKMYYCRFHITGVTIYLSVVAERNCRRRTFGAQSTRRRTSRFYTYILYCRYRLKRVFS